MIHGSGKLLVLDNDVDVLLALERVLETEGYSTDLAVDLEQAIGAVKRSPVDVVLFDDDLPDAGASEVVQRLRERGCEAEYLVLRPRAATATHAAGSGDVVCKFSPAEVVQKVQESLARRKQVTA